MNSEDNRFVRGVNDFYITNELGNKLVGEDLIKYLKDNRENLLTDKEEFNIGDWVKLKNTLEIVKVCQKDFHGFKYAGERENNKGNLVLFNQEDIIQKVPPKVK